MKSVVTQFTWNNDDYLHIKNDQYTAVKFGWPTEHSEFFFQIIQWPEFEKVCTAFNT